MRIVLALVLMLTVVGVTAMQAKKLPQDLPKELLVLSRATVFAYGNGGESNQPEEHYAAYLTACKNWQSCNFQDLEWMLKNATPAGKLYAAALIHEMRLANGKTDGNEGFRTLLTDQSKVSYQTGCKGFSFKVSGIAQAFNDKGKFMNFQLSLKPQVEK